MSNDRLKSLEAMTKTLHWKKFIKDIEEDFVKLSKKVSTERLPEPQEELYKDWCRAYNILINLVEEERKKTISMQSQAKIKKEVY